MRIYVNVKFSIFFRQCQMNISWGHTCWTNTTSLTIWFPLQHHFQRTKKSRIKLLKNPSWPTMLTSCFHVNFAAKVTTTMRSWWDIWHWSTSMTNFLKRMGMMKAVLFVQKLSKIRTTCHFIWHGLIKLWQIYWNKINKMKYNKKY